MARSRAYRRGFTIIDLIALIAILVFVLAILVPMTYHFRQSNRGGSNRVKCASNLRQIGQAMMLYCNDNNGQFPRTIYDPTDPATRTYTGKAPNPFGSGGPDANDVTAAYFLLLRTEDIGAGVFQCPDDDAATSWNGNFDAQKYSNFPGRTCLSYSFISPYQPIFDHSGMGSTSGIGSQNPLDPMIPLAADMNPGSPLQLSKGTKGSLTPTNSPNHGGDGQNVLFADGHAEFFFGPVFNGTIPDIYAAGSFYPATQPAGATTRPSVAVTLLPTDQDHPGEPKPPPPLQTQTWREWIAARSLLTIAAVTLLVLWGVLRVAIKRPMAK